MNKRTEVLRKQNIFWFLLLEDLFIIFSLKSHEIKTYQTLFYKENLRKFDICAMLNQNYWRKIFFNFKQFDGSVGVSKADQGPPFGKYIRYLLLWWLLGFSKTAILRSIIPLISVSTCNEWNRSNNFFLSVLCLCYLNNFPLAFSRF